MAMRFKLVHFLLHVPCFNKLRLLWEMWWYFESSSPYLHKNHTFSEAKFSKESKNVIKIDIHVGGSIQKIHTKICLENWNFIATLHFPL